MRYSAAAAKLAAPVNAIRTNSMLRTRPIRNPVLLLTLLSAVLVGCSDNDIATERAGGTASQEVGGANGTAPGTRAQAEDVPPPGAVTDLRGPLAEEGDASPAVTAITAITEEDQPPALEWDALIPDDYRPDKLMEQFELDDLSDDDPRAAELMQKLKELWDKAPVREDLDGRQVRLPGFVVPVEADEQETTAFLLVPYYGACVHVPPPPANQTVYVVTETGKGTRPELFDVIWVSGTMSVKRIDNDIAEAGYTLYASDIAPYE